MGAPFGGLPLLWKTDCIEWLLRTFVRDLSWRTVRLSAVLLYLGRNLITGKL